MNTIESLEAISTRLQQIERQHRRARRLAQVAAVLAVLGWLSVAGILVHSRFAPPPRELTIRSDFGEMAVLTGTGLLLLSQTWKCE
jgi:hypothetical protein